MLLHNQVKYKHVFSSDIIKQKEATETYKNLLTLREKLLNNLPVSDTGPVHLFAKVFIYYHLWYLYIFFMGI